MRDRVAIATAATTGFIARNTPRSAGSYAVEACIAALRDVGLTAADVDGICGTSPEASYIQSALGIPQVTWYANPSIPFLNQLAAASSAVHAGLCDTVLLYHAAYRLPWNTSSAIKDPFRRPAALVDPRAVPAVESVAGSVGYAAWGTRYLHEHGLGREDLGLVAINGRTHAARNPAAAMQDPITMDDYLGTRMVRWPLCLLDMDIAVDGGDAFVVTTRERAADLPHRPVLINALSLGMTAKNVEDQSVDLRSHGQQVVVEALKAKGDFWIEDVDVYFPYDGFTPIMLNWIENAGWCGPGEAGDFLREHWRTDEASVLVRGRIPLNPHGGSLSEGATQGSGHLREAVHQLQGRAEGRQVEGARRAIVTAGGYFFNAQGVTLRTE